MRARVISYLLLFPAISMTTPASVFAADIEHGKKLYEQYCTRCHDTRVHTRADRKMNSLEALKNQVERCEVMRSAEWPQPDIDDVVAYLDATFYKFSGTAGGVQK